MKLELKQIFDIPGESRDFSYELSLADYELYGCKPFAGPVAVSGIVANSVGIVTLRYTVEFRLRLPCDRCLDEFEREYRLSFDETLVLEESLTHDEYIPAPGGVLDLDEQCLADILLSLPTKQLCREDCKGLCPQCGANLNHGGCQHTPD